MAERIREGASAAGISDEMARPGSMDMVWTDSNGKSYTVSELGAAFPGGPETIPESLFPVALSLTFTKEAVASDWAMQQAQQQQSAGSALMDALSKKAWALVWWCVVFIPLVGPSLMYAQFRRLCNRLSVCPNRARMLQSQRRVRASAIKSTAPVLERAHGEAPVMAFA